MSALTKHNYDYDNNLQPRKKKRVIKKKKRNRITLEGLKNWLVVCMIFALGIGIVYNYSIITEKKMAIMEIDEEISKLNEDIGKYNISLETYNSTQTIEDLAKSYLGLNYATRKQIKLIEVTPRKVATEDDGSKSVSFIEKALNFFR